MKYVAWLNHDSYHKYHLISKLTTHQYINFITLFIKNPKQTEFILFKKLYQLFNCSHLRSYDENELLKLNTVASCIPLLDAVILLNNVNHQLVNKYNAKKLLLYLRDKDDFINHNIIIRWGTGNHQDVTTNIREHFNKHVVLLPDEWNQHLDLNGYRDYAITAFYKMNNVIIHTDGTGVYLSGFYGKIFIIGRYDNDIFGISSCYYVHNGEKAGRYKGLCFRITFND